MLNQCGSTAPTIITEPELPESLLEPENTESILRPLEGCNMLAHTQVCGTLKSVVWYFEEGDVVL